KKVIIDVEERKPFGIWCKVSPIASSTVAGAGATAPFCRWFDSDGVATRRALDSYGSLIITVDDPSKNELIPGTEVLPHAFVKNLFTIFRALRDAGVNIKEIRLRDLALEELEVDTYDNPRIYFSLRFPADSIAAVIKNFKNKSAFNN